ncbi:TrkH-domain-containing protein [Rickenella mellea]|uniref:Potassium transport protein n=1 Tax=Rickenella mellea TaxID=50990 RepID=A0A4Y7Q9U7_9AGAM|nr:TrkH-domain-containing protein [Rickenella mellea]
MALLTRNAIVRHLNFYRIHLLLFIVVPIFASLIFYWLNDARSHNGPFVSYIDSLFLCVSAATVAGLYTVDLSNLEVGQQIVLAFLTAIGSYSFVSTTMVVIRRHYFSKEMQHKLELVMKLQDVVRADADVKSAKEQSSGSQSTPNSSSQSANGNHNAQPPPAQTQLSPMGDREATLTMTDDLNHIAFASAMDGRTHTHDGNVNMLDTHNIRRRTGVSMQRVETAGSQTPAQGVRLRRSDTQATLMDRGYGGFPSPTKILRQITARILGRRGVPLTRHLTNKFTIPRTQTLQSIHNVNIIDPNSSPNPYIKIVPYLTFDATVGKNSTFQDLSEEQKDELGGVEFCALKMLAWVVPCYWLGVQLLCFVALAPYMARGEFRDTLRTTFGQAGPVNSTWFALFQVLSSYANNGILVDASVVPFQRAYFLLFVMMFLILAGNTAFPCFLRLFLWIGSKCVPKKSQAYATLRFILDHPRRCFLYLFPSTQTWYLVAVLISLNGIDWILFLLLDIGNPPIQSIPPGVRVVAGLFQAVAVRCGGFQVVSLGSLAPAVQVLYVVMMYVGALPIALGVRSTNVYEDRSIALFEQEVDVSDEEPTIQIGHGLTKTQVWGEYMAWHLKRQLSFDLWWLALALLLICIFERGKILSPVEGTYITVWTILFEIVSGYGTVGLSLGVPNQNFSMSGSLGSASKLVLCAVMLRGRHRGLPAAIDRSVLLPGELGRQNEMEAEFQQRRDVVRSALRNAQAEVREMRMGDGMEAEDIPPGLP